MRRFSKTKQVPPPHMGIIKQLILAWALVMGGSNWAYGLDFNLPPGGVAPTPRLFSEERPGIDENIGASVLHGMQGNLSVVAVQPIGLDINLLRGPFPAPKLTLNLPDGSEVYATWTGSNSPGKKALVWSGDIRQADMDGGMIIGHAIFVLKGNRVTGQIAINGKIFEVVTANEGGRYFIAERDFSKLPDGDDTPGNTNIPQLFSKGKTPKKGVKRHIGASILLGLRSDPSVVSTKPIDINPSLLTAASPALDLNLPDVLPMRADLRESYALDDQSIVWSGVVTLSTPDNRSVKGEALFVVTGDRVSGKIDANGETYEVITANEGKRYFLVERDMSKLPEADDTPQNTNLVDQMFDEATVGLAAVKTTKIRILQAATPQAVAELGGQAAAKDRMLFFLGQANAVYTNNGLPIRLVNAGVRFHTANQPTNDGPNLVNRLQNTTDGYLDGFAKTTRNNVSADLVGLVVDSNLTSSFGGLCGIAHAVAAKASQGFFLVNQTCTNFTFVHEIGHLFGARHDNDPSTVPFADGHGFVNTSGNFRTVMAVSSNPQPRIGYFSTDDQTYNGFSLGNGQFFNNERVHRVRRATIAGFR